MGRFLRLNTTAGARNSTGGIIELTGFTSGIRIVIGKPGRTVDTIRLTDSSTILMPSSATVLDECILKGEEFKSTRHLQLLIEEIAQDLHRIFWE
jgi:hypothetical protein